VDIIAARMVQERQIKPARAEALLTELRAAGTGQAPSAIVETTSAFGG